ncbi:MAG: hypothetical protein C0404_00600 [Verrucomicrobia bacterium]|nr:hypothetical protein [Verrucomicrobiota bacterium]
MKSLFSGMLGGAVLWLLRRYKQLSVDLLKLNTVIWYVHGVRMARKVFLSFVFLALYFMLAASGFILLHIGLYKLLPSPANALALLALGATYLVLALLGLGCICSEEAWMKGSNAAKLTEMVTKEEDRS